MPHGHSLERAASLLKSHEAYNSRLRLWRGGLVCVIRPGNIGLAALRSWHRGEVRSCIVGRGGIFFGEAIIALLMFECHVW